MHSRLGLCPRPRWESSHSEQWRRYNRVCQTNRLSSWVAEHFLINRTNTSFIFALWPFRFMWSERVPVITYFIRRGCVAAGETYTIPQHYKSYLCYCCNMILCLYAWVYFYFLCNVCVFFFFFFFHKVASLRPMPVLAPCHLIYTCSIVLHYIATS